MWRFGAEGDCGCVMSRQAFGGLYQLIFWSSHEGGQSCKQGRNGRFNPKALRDRVYPVANLLAQSLDFHAG